MSDFNGQEYEPLFLDGIHRFSKLLNVDEWCEGFVKGLKLWGEIKPEAMKQLETCLYPIRHFCTDNGFEALASMPDNVIYQLQPSINLKLMRSTSTFTNPLKGLISRLYVPLRRWGAMIPIPVVVTKNIKNDAA
jgi:hypothetical protein